MSQVCSYFWDSIYFGLSLLPYSRLFRWKRLVWTTFQAKPPKKIVHALVLHVKFPSCMHDQVCIMKVIFFPPSFDSMKYDQCKLSLRNENNANQLSNQSSKTFSVRRTLYQAAYLSASSKWLETNLNSDVSKVWSWTAWQSGGNAARVVAAVSPAKNCPPVSLSVQPPC